MQKLKNTTDIPVVVKVETAKEFLARGKKIAKLLDKKKIFSPIRTISFEDVHDLVSFLTDTKINLLSTIRKKSFSITDLAKKLNRSRAAVHKDVQLLESVGILKSEYINNPGHGRHRMIKAFDRLPIKFTVEATI